MKTKKEIKEEIKAFKRYIRYWKKKISEAQYDIRRYGKDIKDFENKINKLKQLL